jgi:hypothetical protein
MRVPRQLTGALAGALTGPLLLLAACGGDDTSIADPPVSPGSTSSSPAHAPRGSAEAFIRRWADAEKRMENTGDAATYLSISESCLACRQLAQDISRYYSAGGYVKWGGWRFRSITRDESRGNTIVYVVKVNSQPTTYRKSAAGSVHHLPGGPSTHQLTLKHTSGGWQMLVKAQLAA